jgi:hypothetical protein
MGSSTKELVFLRCTSVHHHQNAILHAITSNMPHKLDDRNHTRYANELEPRRRLDFM